MGELTIGTQPQAIYPDGQQDTFVITNNGPWTIYVDSDSSINENVSHPIPPTGVMVWDAFRPLWMVCASLAGTSEGSRVTITRNSTPSVFSNYLDSVLADVTQTINGSATLDTGVLECSAFDYITVGLNCAAMEYALGDLLAAAKQYRIDVVWFDSTGTPIVDDLVNLPGYYGGSESGFFTDPAYSKAILKVRGPFVQIGVSVQGAAKQVHCRVTGTTRPVSPGMIWNSFDSPQSINPPVGAVDASADYALIDMSGIAGTFQFYMPNLYRNAHVTYSNAAGATVAGTLSLRDPLSLAAGYISALFALPVALSHIVADLVLPLYHPSVLVIVPPNTPAPNPSIATIVFS